MNKLLLNSLSLSALLAPALAAYATGPQRIGVVDDDEVKIYALGTLSGNSGVYQIPTAGSFQALKLSTGTMTQYYFKDSGATFVSTSTAYGTCDVGYSVYGGKITAQGDGVNGPWSHTSWSYRNSSFQNYDYRVVASDMTFDPVSGQIYGWFKADSKGSTWNLAVYDGERVATTPVGQPTSLAITAIAADASGELWGIEGSTGTLYAINKTTGATEARGTLGVTAAGTGQSAAIDPATGKMYWGAVVSNSSATLQAIDIPTATATTVYDFPTGQRFSGFFIPAPATPANAPAAVDDLAAVYTGSGSDMKVSFTAPSTTFGGSQLSGSLTYTLELDGEQLAGGTGTVNAGARFEQTFAFPEGTHTLGVSVANRSGKGPLATIATFTGYDTPGKIAEVTATADGFDVTVSWTAPAGVNGGHPDPAKLRYNVRRMPEGVVVENSTTATSVTDRIPESHAAEYVYEVTAVYDGIPATAARSNALMIGTPYTVPYFENFDQAASLGSAGYTQIDLDPSTPSWQLTDIDGGKCLSIKGEREVNHRDYLFSAPIELKASTVYTLSMKMSKAAPNAAVQLRVFLSRSATDDNSAFVTPYIAPNTNISIPASEPGAFVDREFTFSVDESGVYYLGLYDFSMRWDANEIFIDDIRITAEETGYLTDLVLESVEGMPKRLGFGESASVAVTVGNNGTTPAENYSIEIITTEGVTLASAAGTPVAPEKSATTTVDLPWSEAMVPAAELIVFVGIDGDEDPANNRSDVYAVDVDPDPATSAEIAEADNVTVGLTADGAIEVTGAEGRPAAVYTADGRCVASVKAAPATWRVAPGPGVHIVSAAGTTARVITR